MKSARSLILLLSAVIPIATGEPDSSSSLISIITKLPKCAVECIGNSLTKTSCNLEDEKCLCSDQVFQATSTSCVLKACTKKEALTVKNLTSQACHEPIRDKTGVYIRVSDVLGIISALFIIQRFAYKLWTKQDFWLDDWFALATIVSGAPSTVINAYGVSANGIGRDAWTLTFDQLYNFGKFFYVLEVLYFLQITLLKLSFIFFFLRIFPAPLVRRLLWGGVVFTSLYGIIFTFIGIFTCTPVNYFWEKWDEEHAGKCMDINIIAWSNAGIGIAIDVWMLAIPLWQLKGLKMHWKKKISVAVMFLLGTFVTIVSILRLRSIVEFGADSMNPTWDYLEVSHWSCIEVNVGIWCSCLPSFRLLVVRLLPALGGSTSRGYARYDSSDNQKRDKSNRDESGKHITYNKSYAVEVSDLDQVALVQMGNRSSHTRISSSRGGI